MIKNKGSIQGTDIKFDLKILSSDEIELNVNENRIEDLLRDLSYLSGDDENKVQIITAIKNSDDIDAKIVAQMLTGENMGVAPENLENLGTDFLLKFADPNSVNKDLVVDTFILQVDSNSLNSETTDNFEKILNLGNSDLNVNILGVLIEIDENNEDKEDSKNNPTNNLAKVCSSNLNCLTALDKLVSSETLLTAYQTNIIDTFYEKLGNGEIRYNEKDFSEYLAKESTKLNPQELQDLVNAANSGNCKDANWGTLICKWLDNIDATELQLTQFQNEIDELLNSNFNTYVEGQKIKLSNDKEVDCSGKTKEVCEEIIENSCGSLSNLGDKNDCIESGNNKLDSLKTIDGTNYGNFNQMVLNKLLSKFDLCGGNSQGEDKCNDLIHKVCDQDVTSSECRDAIKSSCEGTACEAYDDLARKMVKESYVETSGVFDFIAYFMNPDQNAIAASRLFGFEADTSDLPPWLTYDTASYICLAKIDGYLDTQIKSTQEDSVGNTGKTGTTQYGCSIEMEYEYDSTTGSYVQNEGHPCLEVIADLRGERSGILPDGSILVTYSGYIKAPPSLNITYDLYIAYLDNMSRTQFVDLNTLNEDGLAFKKINAGGEDSFYSAISIPVDESSSLKKNLGNNDVKIGIIAYFENSNQEYVNILTPAYEISADIYVDPLGQDQESSNTNNNQNDEDNTEDEEEDTMDSDQVTNNRCKSTGQC